MRSLPVAAALLLVAACSPAPTEAPEPTPTAASATPAPPPPAEPSPTPTITPAAADILTLEGLGPLRIGRPVPAGGGWASRGAQIPDTPCRTVSSQRFPGVYAIVEDGVVRRISVGERSAVRLIEGIGPDSPERAVRDAFPGFRETPHDYVAAPGKNLTTPGLARGDTGLRFEIDGEGRVSTMHVGSVPVLGYSEGCA